MCVVFRVSAQSGTLKLCMVASLTLQFTASNTFQVPGKIRVISYFKKPGRPHQALESSYLINLLNVFQKHHISLLTLIKFHPWMRHPVIVTMGPSTVRVLLVGEVSQGATQFRNPPLLSRPYQPELSPRPPPTQSSFK